MRCFDLVLDANETDFTSWLTTSAKIDPIYFHVLNCAAYALDKPAACLPNITCQLVPPNAEWPHTCLHLGEFAAVDIIRLTKDRTQVLGSVPRNEESEMIFSGCETGTLELMDALYLEIRRVFPVISDKPTEGGLSESAENDAVNVQHGKAGRKPDPLYAKAFEMMCANTPQSEARAWFYKEAGIITPDEKSDNAFNQAMRRCKQRLQNRRQNIS